MRLWLSKNSDVSLREQLAAQIVLAITSGELKTGARLPSVRQVARRYAVHSNTVSAAYAELTRRGWVEARTGSGVFVCDNEQAKPATITKTNDGEDDLEILLNRFLCVIEKRGYTVDEVCARLSARPRLALPDAFLLVEPDADLRRILAAEIAEAVDLPLHTLDVEAQVIGANENDDNEISAACFFKQTNHDVSAVALHNQAAFARRILPPETPLILLHTRSVIESLRGETLPPPDAIITVVSACTEFLAFARRVLVAVGIDTDALDFRDARSPDWQRGLTNSHLVVCDALIARALPHNTNVRLFRIIGNEGIETLQTYANRF